MFGLFGWLLLFLGGIVLYHIVHLIRQAFFKRELKTRGTLVIATVINVQQQVRSERSSLSETTWGMIPYHTITAQWRHPKTQQIYTFKKTIRGPLPRRYVPGHSVYVLVDSTNPKRYDLEL